MPEGRSFGHCFACGYRQTWIGAALEHLGHSREARGPAFRAAIALLAERAGVALEASAAEPAPMRRVLMAAAAYLKQALLADTPVAATCRSYLVTRGIPETLLPRLPVGALDDPARFGTALRAHGIPAASVAATGLLAAYAARHPLIFFYTDADGLTGFKCRKPDPDQKAIMNAKGFGGTRERASLFALDLAREAIAAAGAAIVVEGEFDALVWHAVALARETAVELVALGGSGKASLPKFQTLRACGARLVYLALDGDAAGEAATAAACAVAWQAGVEVCVLPMPDGVKDPDEALRRLGPAAAQQALFARERAQPGARWLARYLVRTRPPTTPDAHAQLRHAAAPAALAMPATQREAFAYSLAPPLGTTPAALHEEWMATARERCEAAVRADLSAWARQFALSVGHGVLLERLRDAEARLAQARAQLASSTATPLPLAHERDRA
jgi:DNA primase